MLSSKTVNGSKQSVKELSQAVDYLASTCATLEDVLKKLAVDKGVYETLAVASAHAPSGPYPALPQTGTEITGNTGGAQRARISRAPVPSPLPGPGTGSAPSRTAANASKAAAAFSLYASKREGVLTEAACNEFLAHSGLAQATYMNGVTATTPERLFLVLQLKYKEVKFTQFVSLVATLAQWHYPGTAKEAATERLFDEVINPGIAAATGHAPLATAAGVREAALPLREPRAAPFVGVQSSYGAGYTPQRGDAGGAKAAVGPGAAPARKKKAPASKPAWNSFTSDKAKVKRRPQSAAPGGRAGDRARTPSPYGGLSSGYGRGYHPEQVARSPPPPSPVPHAGSSSFRAPATSRAADRRAITPPPVMARKGGNWDDYGSYSSFGLSGSFAAKGGSAAFRSPDTGRLGDSPSPPPGTWSVRPGDPRAHGRSSTSGGIARIRTGTRPASAGPRTRPGGGGERPASASAGAKGRGGRRRSQGTQAYDLSGSSFAKPTKSSSVQREARLSELADRQQKREARQSLGEFRFGKERTSTSAVVDDLFDPRVESDEVAMAGKWGGQAPRSESRLSAGSPAATPPRAPRSFGSSVER
mmetsp:Transcript_36911/g.116080  ORF Transcript_36911/g.116080 Transcript_36911/m.116080 type:complete len:589 (+) Transcript_36911:140-1906(+)